MRINVKKQEQGIIQKILEPGKARVLVLTPGDCESCGAKKSCGALTGNKQRIIEARFEKELSLKEGEKVDIHVTEGSRIMASLLLFLLPLLAMIGGYWIGFALFSKEGAGILFSLAALAITFALITLAIKKVPALQKAACHITRS